MPVIEIKTYALEVVGGQGSGIRARIYLYDDKGGTLGYLFFVEVPLPPPGGGPGVPQAYLPFAAYPAALDMLRNEAPVFLVTNPGGKVSLMTKPERVGEGEAESGGFPFALG